MDTPPEPNDEMRQLGAFDPLEAKRILPMLETLGIPFEIDTDHSPLLHQGRAMQLLMGMYPAGSQMLIFVPASRMMEAEELLKLIFPV
jgi:hypothetical protein